MVKIGNLLMAVLVVFLLVANAAPARAQTGGAQGHLPTAQLHFVAGGGDILSIPKVDKLLKMDFRRLLAWIGGLAVGNFLIEGYLSGLQVPYLGLILGGLIGEFWYSKRIFPFDGTI